MCERKILMLYSQEKFQCYIRDILQIVVCFRDPGAQLFIAKTIILAPLDTVN